GGSSRCRWPETPRQTPSPGWRSSSRRRAFAPADWRAFEGEISSAFSLPAPSGISQVRLGRTKEFFSFVGSGLAQRVVPVPPHPFRVPDLLVKLGQGRLCEKRIASFRLHLSGGQLNLLFGDAG